MNAGVRYEPDDPREWLNRARSNLIRAGTQQEGVYHEDLCYDAQQAAEKAIKAVLIVLNVRFPYVHDLQVLLEVVERAGCAVPREVRAAAALTRYADVRYPDRLNVDAAAHAHAVEIARVVVQWATNAVAEAAPGPDEVREQVAAAYATWGRRTEGHAPDAALLDALVARIVAAADPQRIILFGSAARGTMGPHSDLDVLVVKSAPDVDAQLASAVRAAVSDLGVSVDVIVATPDILERYGHSWALVYRPALEEGRVIYDATRQIGDPTQPHARGAVA